MKFFMSGEIDGEVGEAFRKIRKEVEEKIKTLMQNDYGSEIVDIGVIPIIVKLSPELEEAGFFKERKLLRKGDADYRLRINFEKFLNAGYETKRLLIIKNVIESIRAIGLRAKKDFDAKRLEYDILNILEVNKNDIDELSM